MNEKISKRISEIAKSLPPVKYYGPKLMKLIGAEILLKMSEYEIPEGMIIDPEKTYQIHHTRFLYDINHTARIKRYYYQHGEDGIQMYFDWLKNHIIEMAKTDMYHQELMNNIAFQK